MIDKMHQEDTMDKQIQRIGGGDEKMNTGYPPSVYH